MLPKNGPIANHAELWNMTIINILDNKSMLFNLQRLVQRLQCP